MIPTKKRTKVLLFLHVCKKSSIFVRNFVLMRYFIHILLVFISVILVGCSQETNQTTTSSDARVKNFTFYKDTINPGLTAAIYKVEHRSDTGLIYNVDSLLFGTKIDSAVPYITYMATPGSATYILPDTTIESTGADTINFTKKPIYLHVISSDLENEKWYRIAISVHQADPELYVWEQMTERIFAEQNCETKAFFHKGELLTLMNNGMSTQAYQSTNGSDWAQLSSHISTLPTPCHVRDIVQHNDTLYYIDNNALYRSTDGVTWIKWVNSAIEYELVNMVLSYAGKAWCLVQNVNNELQLATIAQDSIAVMDQLVGYKNGILPSNFPISDFAALSFSSSSERPRAMIVGGRDIQGNVVNTRWNIEYAATDGYRMKDFSIAQPSFKSLTGISIIQYENRLIMFGGTDSNLKWRSDMLYSDDEGMNWYVPDTAHNKLPDTYITRQNQSVVTDNKQNIYIIGGQSQTKSLSDVYRGFLNSAKWE